MDITISIDERQLQTEAEKIALEQFRKDAYDGLLDTIKGLPYGLTTEWHEFVQSAIHEAFEKAFAKQFDVWGVDHLAEAVAIKLLDNDLFTLRLIRHIGKERK